MIGIFDSGLGGLTILKAFIEKLPEYDYMYLGDNARSPYGNKSQDLIYQYAKEAIDFLFKRDCQLVVLACNTASAKALRKLQQERLPKNYPDRRVLGVVIPAVQAVAEIIKKNPRKNKLGIIGTRSTIESGVYEKELAKTGLKIEIFKQACPLLVPLIEEGWTKRPETKMILRYYLRGLKKARINNLILACTHYPILLKQIENIMGPQCRVLDSPRFTAEKLADYLKRHPEIETKLSKNKTRLFYTTDKAAMFKELGQRFLDSEIGEVEKAKLE
ncbi:glutamate racemase [Candidatus Falkowbacteria bacterium CG11_big_fil_rev_8_21_14_0_20_39_10]|uniref:Glutamate racemase n=1 Tax=Candidatus Falkowbacteria bacterium CG11_big_fil_rev_8_21_14_0_20_39_10 TaxID=1974570 RepID=A0A2M6K989_9BACT|nr:MAG: glutamate racemase [Candidatus Falkowbacteria bacterium CG11_big_fil_rev_8_21_14_0_20_39_10]